MAFAKKNVYLALPATTRGSPVHLGVDPKGQWLVYANGRSVVVRNIENPLLGYTYGEHTHNATVAKFSPSGFYIASGDESGRVRIWDTVNEEHVLANEFRPLSGPIRDLTWSEDSKRIVVVGEGRESFGAVFLADSGSSVGAIEGHSKGCTSCDFKQTRPYRIASASIDQTTVFFEGPPFKFSGSHTDHTRFVNCVRFAPDGSRYLSVGSDAKGYFYDGKTGSLIGPLAADGADVHTAGIMSCAWSPDSKQVVTASMDGSCKVWDVASNTCAGTFSIGKEVDDQQVGCLWVNNRILSVSLSGYINYLDPTQPGTCQRVVKGFQKPIKSCLAVAPEGGAFFAASYDGRMAKFVPGNGEPTVFAGNGHGAVITDLRASGDDIITCGFDDRLRTTPAAGDAFGTDAIALTSQPQGLGVGAGGVTVVACLGGVAVVRGGAVVTDIKTAFEATCAAVRPDGQAICVGGKNNAAHIYTLSGDEGTSIAAKGEVTDVAWSPDGKYLAVADSLRQILVVDGSTYEVFTRSWCFHTGRVQSIAWAPCSQYLASGGTDQNVFVWNTQKKTAKIAIKNAHATGPVHRVAWLDDSTVLSAGDDACIREWTITHSW